MALPLWQTMKQKHSQNVMAIIFSSGCYAPYIYYNSYTTPLSQASTVFDLLFYHSARPFYTIVHCGISVFGCMWVVTLITHPDSIPYNGTCKCLVREIEVIMHVRVRLCKNACVSRRMRESWQLCQQGILQLTINQIQVSHSVSVLRTGETPLFGLK